MRSVVRPRRAVRRRYVCGDDVQVLYAYFLGCPLEEAMAVSIPRNTAIQVGARAALLCLPVARP